MHLDDRVIRSDCGVCNGAMVFGRWHCRCCGTTYVSPPAPFPFPPVEPVVESFGLAVLAMVVLAVAVMGAIALATWHR